LARPMKIGALARSLGVPVPTLRRWTQEFAEGLSPEAHGGDGRPREFSPRDQRVLRRARELLADGDMTYAQARRRLREEGLLVSPPVASEREESPSGPGPATEEERAAAERFVTAIVERAARPWVERLEQLEREVEALRQQVAALQASREAAETSASARRRWPFG
jgi:DNA-binding transcriptional MerR regulator